MEQISTLEYPKQITNKGYVRINIEGEWILEHVYICQCQLGRKLKKEEVCHHLNFCKQDNRINNLMVFPNQKEHQKFHNKLKRYGYYTNPMKRQILNRWNLEKDEI